MKRWSLTPLANELDVLEIRLATLDDVVDVHVLAESPLTQNGRRKDLLFPTAKKRLGPWLKKIRYVVVDDMPRGRGSASDWRREAFQRDACLRAIQGMRAGDRVLLSDLDEIPTPQALERIAPGPPVRLPMTMHVGRLNWCWPEQPVMGGTRAVCVDGWFLLRGLLPSQLVSQQVTPWMPAHAKQAPQGWHLAYQADVETIREKILSIADDFRRPEFLDRSHILNCLETGVDLFGRDHRRSVWLPLTALPPYVRQHRDKFARLTVDRPRT